MVMEREDYNRKVRELLDDTSTYCKLPKDRTPTQESKISRKLKTLHNGKEIRAFVVHLSYFPVLSMASKACGRTASFHYPLWI